jgi:hypothetical protein
MSEELNLFHAALAKMQGEFKNVEMDCTGKSRKTMQTYKYASLKAIIEMIRKPMADNGFSHTHKVYSVTEGEQTNDYCDTVVSHKDGGSLVSGPMKLIIDEGGMQALGSAITYARRYQISALLGIVTEEDDDGLSTQPQKPLATSPRSTVKANEPVKRPPSDPPKSNAENIALKKKLAGNLVKLFDVVKKKELSSGMMTGLMQTLFGKASSDLLSADEVQELIDFVASNDKKQLEEFLKDQPVNDKEAPLENN